MKKVFKIRMPGDKRKPPQEPQQITWENPNLPLMYIITATIRLLPSQRTMGGEWYITLKKKRKIVTHPTVQIHFQHLMEVFSTIDFREAWEVNMTTNLARPESPPINIQPLMTEDWHAIYRYELLTKYDLKHPIQDVRIIPKH